MKEELISEKIKKSVASIAKLKKIIMPTDFSYSFLTLPNGDIQVNYAEAFKGLRKKTFLTIANNSKVAFEQTFSQKNLKIELKLFPQKRAVTMTLICPRELKGAMAPALFGEILPYFIESHKDALNFLSALVIGLQIILSKKMILPKIES